MWKTELFLNFSAEVKRTLCFKLFKHIGTKQALLLHSNINSISISVQCFIDKTVIISKHSAVPNEQQVPLTDSHNLHFDRSTNTTWIPLPEFYTSAFLGTGKYHNVKLQSRASRRGKSVRGVSELLGNQGSIHSRVKRTCSSAQPGRNLCPHNFRHI